jgi:hypothetical protein
MIYQGSARHPVIEACVHTSATTDSWWRGKTVEQMRDEIRLWHVRDRGWRDIGYHRIIAPDGKMATGRSLYEVGAGVVGHNRGVVHICLIPVHTIERMGTFDDFYTRAQRVALRDYLLELEKLSSVHLKVTGHNVYAAKLCPGFIVEQDEWL